MNEQSRASINPLAEGLSSRSISRVIMSPENEEKLVTNLEHIAYELHELVEAVKELETSIGRHMDD